MRSRSRSPRVRSAANEIASRAASSMWRTRIASSGPKLDLDVPEHLVAEVPAELSWCPEVDLPTQDAAQLELHRGEIQEAPRAPGSNSMSTSTSLSGRNLSVSTDPNEASDERRAFDDHRHRVLRHVNVTPLS